MTIFKSLSVLSESEVCFFTCMKGDEQNTERDIRTIKVETYSTKVVDPKEDAACKKRKL